eukprot:scaffold266275_cov32-Prasinocladus_malaysianus.AAC.1
MELLNSDRHRPGQAHGHGVAGYGTVAFHYSFLHRPRHNAGVHRRHGSARALPQGKHNSTRLLDHPGGCLLTRHTVDGTGNGGPPHGFRPQPLGQPGRGRPDSLQGGRSLHSSVRRRPDGLASGHIRLGRGLNRPRK